MTRWVLHAGYSKTGTTALQEFLATRRTALLGRGVLYPDATIAGLPLRMENHNAVAGALAGLPEERGITAERYFQQFSRSAAARPNLDLVILSAEGFSGHPNVVLYPTETAFREAEDHYIGALRALTRPHEVEIVLYLRRQDHWLNTSANQQIKFEGRNAGPAFDTMEEFLAIQKPRLDYLTSLDCWVAHFGAVNVTVRPYESAQLRDNSVISDFMALIGRPDIAEPTGPQAKPANPGLSDDVLEFKRRINPTLRSRSEIEAVGDMLTRISVDMGGNSSSLLNPALRHAIVEEYEPVNREIARRYLGRSDGRLFLEPWPEATDPWEPYPGLSPETEAEIARRLHLRRASLSGQALILRKRLGAALRDSSPKTHLLMRALRGALSWR